MEYEEEVEEEDDDRRSPLRKSLFPNVPPYIRFLPPEEEYSEPLCSSQPLVWKAPSGVGQVVSDCVQPVGFTVIEVLLWFVINSTILYFLTRVSIVRLASLSPPLSGKRWEIWRKRLMK